MQIHKTFEEAVAAVDEMYNAVLQTNGPVATLDGDESEGGEGGDDSGDDQSRRAVDEEDDDAGDDEQVRTLNSERSTSVTSAAVRSSAEFGRTRLAPRNRAFGSD